jgi:K+-transporting ATPase ATPase C chain
MFREFITALRVVVATVVVCGVLYTLAVLAFAMVAAPTSRLGSLVHDEHGHVVGSRLVAQSFSRRVYFWPRPSACDYNASAAGGSNLSPASPLLRARATQVMARLSLPRGTEIPADLVTASGSGLDPHITQAAALVQVPRVATSRNISEDVVRRLIAQQHQDNPLSTFRDESLVNVLLLNLALDRAHPIP